MKFHVRVGDKVFDHPFDWYLGEFEAATWEEAKILAWAELTKRVDFYQLVDEKNESVGYLPPKS